MPEGGCLCGEVRYRVTGEAVARTLCHCVSCRRATGGASVAWAVFEKGDFAVLKGEVREYSSSPGIYWGCPYRAGAACSERRGSHRPPPAPGRAHPSRKIFSIFFPRASSSTSLSR
jgi:hypothetical protein